MTSRLWILFVVALLARGGPGVAQETDNRAVLEAAVKSMGGDVKTVQYSGTTGYVSAVGQNYSPGTIGRQIS